MTNPESNIMSEKKPASGVYAARWLFFDFSPFLYEVPEGGGKGVGGWAEDAYQQTVE
jgi:hypothetical protein